MNHSVENSHGTVIDCTQAESEFLRDKPWQRAEDLPEGVEFAIGTTDSGQSVTVYREQAE